ncbi:MAG TPA: sigma-54 dependent transcriptional regulator [Candidatus Binatia bacterium]
MRQGTLPTSARALPGFMGMFGDHPSMRKVFDIVRRVGPSDVPVLITGESGTGKELVARALHNVSSRASRSFVPVHCGAIPEELLESELFGHVRGAFTGAIASRTGRFQLAHHGTIFLDEIGEMSPRFQVKLLRVLEDGTFDPVGSAATRYADVRVIAATHRDLHAGAREGTFREDLLYRLDVVRIHLPPLRERREDIPVIARHFLDQVAARCRQQPAELLPETADALMSYGWPGNVRELRNVLERAVLLSEEPGVLRPSDLPAPIGSGRVLDEGERKPAPLASPQHPASSGTQIPWDFGPEGTDFYHELESFERRMIDRALQLARGSKREAARLLQVNRTTLLEKLKRRGWYVSKDATVTALGAAPAPARPEEVGPELPRPDATAPVPAMRWPGDGWLDMRRPVARAAYAPAAAPVPQRASQMR